LKSLFLRSHMSNRRMRFFFMARLPPRIAQWHSLEPCDLAQPGTDS
jgi:hypothetical protein